MIATSTALAANSALVEALSVVYAARRGAPIGERSAPGMTLDEAAFTICNVLQKLRSDVHGAPAAGGFAGANMGAQPPDMATWGVENLDSLVATFKTLSSTNVGSFNKIALAQVRELCDNLSQIVEDAEP